MAPSDWDERKRRREREDELDNEIRPNKLGGPQGDLGKRADTPEQSREMMDRADVTIEQLNNLYNSFATGIEMMPPIEKRKQLENLMASLQGSGIVVPAIKFRLSQLVAKFHAHRDRWDRMMKDIESGKIKRITGPRRG